MMPLPGADKYRVAAPPRKLTWEQQVIEKANTDIRIEDVLENYYSIHVPYDAMSWKVRCPWAMEHEDGGLDKQFRIYSDSNNGYCFAMHGRVDNISLYVQSHAMVTRFEAAKNLLEEYGIPYYKKTYQETFQELLEESNKKFDYQDVVESMKFYLNSFDNYSTVEFFPEVIDMVESFNNQARVVCDQANSLGEVEQWYLQEKAKFQQLLLSISG